MTAVERMAEELALDRFCESRFHKLTEVFECAPQRSVLLQGETEPREFVTLIHGQQHQEGAPIEGCDTEEGAFELFRQNWPEYWESQTRYRDTSYLLWRLTPRSYTLPNGKFYIRARLLIAPVPPVEDIDGPTA